MSSDNMVSVSEKRLADLEMVAGYFETQTWDESWPYPVLFALARLVYPDRAPFLVRVGGAYLTEQEVIDMGASDDLGYMYQMRDKDRKRLSPLQIYGVLDGDDDDGGGQ